MGRDEFSMDAVRKPTLVGRLLGLHERFSSADLAVERSRLVKAEVTIYRLAILVYDGSLRTAGARRAAALTYTTILSIFPMLALLSSTVSVFYTPEKEEEFMHAIEKQFLPSMDNLPIQLTDAEEQLVARQKAFNQSVREFFLSVSRKFRESAGGVGIFGFIGLLITSGLLYYSVESVINETWQCRHRAQWTTTLTNFITVLVLAPIIIGISAAGTGAAVTLLDPEWQGHAVPAPPGAAAGEGETSGTQTLATAPRQPVAPAISPTMQRIRSITTGFGFIIPFIPMLLNTVVLAAAFAFLPRARVDVRFALVGGFVTALLWELARYTFFFYISMSSVNKTLADALGLSVVFLLWIYITWVVLLSGNLVTYVLQHFDRLWGERRVGQQMLLDGRLLVATMVLLARRFITAGGGYSESEIRVRLGMRQEDYEEIIRRLHRGNFITPLGTDGYQIAHPPEQISMRDLLRLGCDLNKLPVVQRGSPALAGVFGWLQEETLNIGEGLTLAEVLRKSPEGEGSTSDVALIPPAAST